jgi:hypothetical protein
MSLQNNIAGGGWQPPQVGPISSIIAQMPLLRQAGTQYDVRQMTPEERHMNITHIRNATQIIDYAGKKFLIDPMLADKGAWPGFPGTARSELRNPLVGCLFPAITLSTLMR